MPLPLPLEPDVMVTHEAASDAVHEHPLCVDTVKLPLPPAALKVLPVPDRV